MNTATIVHAANEIDRLSSALVWLRENGVAMKEADKYGFSVRIDINFASACSGAKEAREQLSMITRLHISEIIEDAIRDAANTIECHKQTIARQIQEDTP